MSPVLDEFLLTTNPTPVVLVLLIVAAGKPLLVETSSCDPGLAFPTPTLPPVKYESPKDLIFTDSWFALLLNLYKGLLFSNSVTAKPLPVPSALKA